MVSKTKVNGTEYKVIEGKTSVSGTGYTITKGRTRLSGTGYDVILGRVHITLILIAGDTQEVLAQYYYPAVRDTTFSVALPSFSGYETPMVRYETTPTDDMTVTITYPVETTKYTLTVRYTNANTGQMLASFTYQYAVGETYTIQVPATYNGLNRVSPPTGVYSGTMPARPMTLSAFFR